VEESSTKDKILDAAERLFAKQGIAATSLRKVIKEAGVNTAAVHYYFGSKEGLVEAVLVRRADPINKERLRMLDRVEKAAGPGPLKLEAVLQAFVAPVVGAKLDTSPGRDLFRQLLGRATAEADLRYREMMHRIFREALTRFTAAFSRALPGLPLEELHWRIHFVIGAMAFGIAVRGVHLGTEEGPGDHLDSELLVRRLVEFLGGGLRGGNRPASMEESA
jgi:AcrR family transcriptional regulator